MSSRYPAILHRSWPLLLSVMMMLFDALPRDVAALLASCLSVCELRALVRVSRAASQSIFHERLMCHLRLVLPPNDAVVSRLLRPRRHAAPLAVSLADASHLPLLADCMPQIETLRVSSDGYMQAYEPILHLPRLDSFLSLRRLDLSGSAIIGVVSLASLTELVELDLSFTVVVDLRPLSRLTKLESLNLEDTRVKSIAVVQCMPELRVLNVNRTSALHDLSPITQLKKLEKIGINDKQLVDIEPIRAVAKSLKELDAIEISFPGDIVTPAERHEALASLTQLEHFTTWPMSWTQTLEPLVSLRHLTRLDLRFPPFTDLSPLQALTNLQDLRLMIAAARDTSPLRVLKRLERLVLTGVTHDPHSLNFLDHLPLLRDLSLSGEIHVHNVSRLTHLERVELNYSGVSSQGEKLTRTMCEALSNVISLSLRFPVGHPTDLSPLSCMNQLETLDLRYATPKELPTPDYFAFLHTLVNLKELRLAGGGIQDLQDLRFLTQLRGLDLTSTSVVDLTPLTRLQSLQKIELGYTKIVDVSPLTQLPKLKRVTLPVDTNCTPLAEAEMAELCEVFHEHANCLWNERHRGEYDTKTEVNDVVHGEEALKVLETAFGDYTGDY